MLLTYVHRYIYAHTHKIIKSKIKYLKIENKDNAKKCSQGLEDIIMACEITWKKLCVILSLDCITDEILYLGCGQIINP